MIIISASQKIGAEYPDIEMNEIIVSNHFPCRIPASVPIGIPTSKERINAMVHSSMVAGNTTSNSWRIGTPFLLRPKLNSISCTK
ncbi:Uncharacterised protein [Vibrio cholerae]|uniref:Uncharacterized protein n=1 Tax=Vibrio cholerae TaxID=666 RepID=A0A655XKC3_VIBCL|nr:Uncharacterised protein [Vibrio cholerae]CSB36652.1 Uncharacterised protein [Vibrio cholerae]CSB53805.1 Uncharacterised protein [Vibrio cholerae]CSB53986.1 Uncharacterised protein [Vibrio cholerae]CSB86993.1 Uncharacterised protein [Vibrio cholerae]